MTYEITYAEEVVREQIPSIPMPYKEQIRRAIRERLTADPRIGKPLRYSLFGYRRLRVGDWRVIYKIEGNCVRVVKIANRKDVYED